LAFGGVGREVKYDVNASDERFYLLSLDEVCFDKFAVGVNILLFPTEEIVGACDFVSRLD